EPSARPSLIVHSIAVAFGTGRAPGCARQTGHVRVFWAAPQPASQPQNIFVRVFSWTWISRPITGSQSDMEPLLRRTQRRLDVACHLDHREPVLQRAVHLDQPELALAGLERELRLAHRSEEPSVGTARRREG